MESLESTVSRLTAEKTAAQFAVAWVEEQWRCAVQALYAVMDLHVAEDRARQDKIAGRRIKVNGLTRRRRKAIRLVKRVLNDWNNRPDDPVAPAPAE